LLAKGTKRTDVDLPVVRSHKLDLRVSSEVRAQLVADYEAGTEASELQVIYKLSKGSVSKILREAGVRTHRQLVSEALKAECLRLREQGLTLKQIGEVLGMPQPTVQGVVARSKRS
jgi:hypothetical protein